VSLSGGFTLTQEDYQARNNAWKIEYKIKEIKKCIYYLHILTSKEYDMYGYVRELGEN
jgi:hypothetical protein